MTYDLHWGNPKRDDFNYILDEYSTTSVNSNYTSSIPLAQYWKSTKKVLNLLREKLNLNGLDNNLYFEYPTPSVGSAKSSMSDVMLITGKEKIAIEGKFTEVDENYETIKDWYVTKKTGKEVLAHWVEILKPFINNSEKITKESDMPYQFLHRTASACYKNNERAVCLYQIFVSNNTSESCKNFINKLENSIAELEPNSRLGFYIQKIEIQPLFEKRTPNEDDDFFAQIKTGQKLFEFGDINFLKFDTDSKNFVRI